MAVSQKSIIPCLESLGKKIERSFYLVSFIVTRRGGTMETEESNAFVMRNTANLVFCNRKN